MTSLASPSEVPERPGFLLRASAGLDALPAAGNFTLIRYARRSQIAASIKSRDAKDPVPILVTGQVRAADICLDAGTAVLLAGLTRALVATALTEARRGTPTAAAPARQVAAALAAAARHGPAGAGADPVTGQAADARSPLSRLLDHVYPESGTKWGEATRRASQGPVSG